MYNFTNVEEGVLAKWNKEKILEKLRTKNAGGEKFYFLQGPPYTSGRLHIGHAWNNSLKDVALRYKRMRGFNVWDRGGYDMHGLPTENAVQKKLGYKTKDEIEAHGVDTFVKECMAFSEEMAGYMNNDFERLGVWFDHANAYKPIEKSFMSGQWAFFKKAHEQGRLYKGEKVMHWDAETETSLAKHELEYKTVVDTSVFLKFKVKEEDNAYFVIWTTTPWTIPYNLAIMANPDLDYVKIKVTLEGRDEYWILAKDLVGVFMGSVIGKDFEIVETFKGQDLEGKEYEHFFAADMKQVYTGLKKDWPNVHTVIMSKQYVDTSAGSGLVHCAPGCGPEDQEVAQGYDIGSFNTLSEQGRIESEGEFVGWKAKVDDKKFIKAFEERGVLLATTEVEHEYPHSWRSHKPVVFRTTSQWFLKTQDLIPQLLSMNNDVHWVPKTSGESYVRWASNLKDNSVTRQRYWGCPVPIWVNEEDEDDVLVLGSSEELEKLTGKKLDDLSMHRPWIDEITIEHKGKTYKRIPDVADVWIDSGTASWNCLYNDPKLIAEWFPADLVLEGTEQTRLWFSLLQICSAVMFDTTAYKNVFVHGMMLDFGGTKMSKSLGNIISPYEVLDKHGADVLRNYMCQVSAGENINFSWEDVKIKQRNLNILVNIASYIKDLRKRTTPTSEGLALEDAYMLSRKHSAISKVTALMEEYRIDEIISEMESLYLDLSRVYIKLTRDRSNSDEAGKVLYVLEDVFYDILRMLAIVCPFLTDHLYVDVFADKEASVHLESWPEADTSAIDKKLEADMAGVLDVIEKGLAERDRQKIGLKWPLAEAMVKYHKVLFRDELKSLVAQQLNVKKLQVVLGNYPELSVELDTELTSELAAEGYARELMRHVQSFRKQLGLEKQDVIRLGIEADEHLVSLLLTHQDAIAEKTNAEYIEVVTTLKETFKNKTDFRVKDKRGTIAIAVLSSR